MGVRPEKHGIVHDEAFDLSFTSVLTRNSLSEASWATELNSFRGRK